MNFWKEIKSLPEMEDEVESSKYVNKNWKVVEVIEEDEFILEREKEEGIVVIKKKDEDFYDTLLAWMDHVNLFLDTSPGSL